MSLRRFLAVAALVAIAVVGAAPRPAAAQFTETIDRFAAVLSVDRDGVLHVVETIDYDFGANEKHGIYRYIPVRYPWVDDKYERVYKMSNIQVTGSPGTPTKVKVEDQGRNKTVRIGDEDRTISGKHRYTISYDVRGSLNGFEDHDELYWNITGLGWDVPMRHVEAVVRMPTEVTKLGCFEGPEGSVLPCASAGGSGTNEATFSATNLGAGDGLTVVAAVAPGVITNVEPILDERWSIDRAFSRTTTTVGAAVGLMALMLLLVGRLLWRHGRDRRLLVGGDGEEVVGLFDKNDGPVTYRPPDELRPAQVGVLVDESADPLDVTASIVDLAVRGYLKIEEIPDTGWFSKGDWRLTRLKADDGVLQPYERRLRDALFESGDEVLLSDLKQEFYDDLKKIQDDLYDDSVTQRWFVRRPDRTRALWLGLGLLFTIVGIGAVVLLAAFSHAALVAIPFVIAGLVVLVAHKRMPARTGTGTQTLQQVLGFRRFMTTAQTERMQFAEEEGIFAKYLPYAIVFGVTKQWAKRFEGLDAGSPAMSGMGWYVGVHPFSPMGFSSSMNDFTVQTAGTIVSTPPSASGGSGFGGGGFSGGGGGGGGGGSW
jgi:uncharacterized membrane protein